MATIYDRIREAAAQKDNFVDPSRGPAGPLLQGAPRFNPRPRTGGSGRLTSGSAPRPIGRGVSATPETDRLRALAAQKSSGGGGGFDLGDGLGLAGKGLMGVLSLADAGRRGAQGLMGEIGDWSAGQDNFAAGTVNRLVNPLQLRGLRDPETGERDTNFDLGRANPFDDSNDMSEGFLGRVDWDDSLPGFLRAPIGIAGDLATDPLTYATLGVGGVVKAGASAGARAALPAGREVLAQAAVRNIGKDGVEGVSRELGDRLARELGTRGQGALTRRGLNRVGMTSEQAARTLGREGTIDFGARVGVGGKQVRLPGSARVAENVQDLKGVIKKATGSSRAGKLSRELFTTSKMGEAKMRQEILSGGMNAPTAARALALLGEAKGKSWRWFDESIRELESLGPNSKGLRKVSDDEAVAITHALEAGDLSNPLVQDLAGFFAKKGDELQQAGVPFFLRKGYVPHRLSEKARRAAEAGDEAVLRSGVVDMDLDAAERFQKLRQTDETIAEINAKWRDQGHDYDLLETDIRALATSYIGEGQGGLMRAGLKGNAARDLGLVDDIGKVVDNDAFNKEIARLAKKEGDAIDRSIRTRRSALRKGIAAGKRNVNEVGRQLDQAKTKATRAEARLAKAAARRTELERKLQTATETVGHLQRRVGKLRGAEKRQATLRLNQAQAEVDRFTKELDATTRNFQNAEKDLGRYAEELRLAEEGTAAARAQLDELVAAREALEQSPLAKDAVQAQTDFNKAAFERQAADAKFAGAENEFQVAAKTAQFLRADVQKVSDKASQTLAEYEDWLKRVESIKSAKKRGTPEQRAERDLVRERLDDIRQILKNTKDPVRQDLAKLEAQAIMADADALMAGVQRQTLAGEMMQGQALLTNPRFQNLLKDQLNDTMERMKVHLGDDAQIDSWYREAIEFQRKFNENPGVVLRGFKRALSGYQKGMNWWKGWALSSPGFVARNFYSGAFSAYLDDIPPSAMRRFGFYHHKMMNDGVEAAQAWASKKYGPEAAAQLDQAHSVAAASGWGITHSEFNVDQVGRNMSWNPLSARNPASKFLRDKSEDVEAYLRGGHALGVIQRGGNYDEALARVQKFHFNYRDISDYDRAAKMAIPFWTFFSRNIGLQMSVFAKKPNKLTRSYFNAKRNIEAMSEDDGEPMPDWMRAMQPIRTPFGSAEGRGRMSLTPDIPSIRFMGQADGLAGPGALETLVSGAGPGIKVPYQLLTNRDPFLGREYRNELTGFSEGQQVPRLAPSPLQLPGVRNVLGALPGAENIDGKLLMTDQAEAGLMQVNPALGRAARLFPNNDRQEETFRQYWTNFFGGPVQWNDPGRQAGAMAAARREAEEAARKVQDRIRLEKLVREAG